MMFCGGIGSTSRGVWAQAIAQVEGIVPSACQVMGARGHRRGCFPRTEELRSETGVFRKRSDLTATCERLRIGK
jgi:hypothetical protein